jgi:catechol 2,3-dioxygenase-like lactoylglutathione lyase family enzyme
MKIRSISHVGLTVSNFENAVKWYSEMFGFKLISEQALNKKQVDSLFQLYNLHDTSIRFGFLRAPKGSVVEIFEFSSKHDCEKIVWNRPGYTHLAIDVKNINELYNELKEKGVYFFSEPQNTDGNEWVFLKDPDGNLIELIDLKKNYFLIRVLGGIAGKVMAKKEFKKYYE